MNDGNIEFIVSLKGGTQAASEAKKLEGAVAGIGGKMRQVSADSERAAKRTSTFGGSLKRMAVGLGAVGAAYAAYSAAKSAITYTDELGKSTRTFAKVTNMGVAESSRFVGVAGALGVESSKLAMVFSKLGKATIAQSEATGKHVTAFDRLGISQAEAKAHLNDTAGILDLVTKKLATEHIPAAEKSALMTELFGRAWKNLGPLLLEGEVGLKDYTKAAKEYGLEIGGNSAEALAKFHHEQVESKIAGDALRISFTKLVAGPLGGMLGGFAKLVKYAKEGNWTAFNKQVDAIGRNFSSLAEKVLPKVAEGFARIAPIVLKAFWKGFSKASLGGEAIIAGVLLTKLGVTGGIFQAAGTAMFKSFAKTFAAEGAFAALGTTLGPIFGLAFGIAAAVIIGKKIGEALQEAKTQFFYEDEHGHKRELNKAETEEALRPNPHVKGKLPLVEKYEREHPSHRLPHAAFGGAVMGGGLVEVGERGREVVSLPAGATVSPLAAHSLVDNRPIIVKVDGQVLFRINRRQLMQAQAAGA